MSRDVALYIKPSSHHFLQNRLFVLDEGHLNGERQNAPYVLIKEYFESKGISVQTADYLSEKNGASKKIYVSMGMRDNYHQLAEREDICLSAFFAMECPVVDPGIYKALPEVKKYYKRIFSWSDSPSLERFVGGPIELETYKWPQSFDAVHEGIWNNTDRKFLMMINANKLPTVYWKELYTERLKAIEFFNRTGEIDLYGKGWDQIPWKLNNTIPYTFKLIDRYFGEIKQKVWPNPLYSATVRANKGPVESKMKVLGQYNFAICFENSILTGWITEKMFDCFFAGAVPVYWGAPDILDWVPAECFIDMRKFENYSKLRDYLHSLSREEIIQYRVAARDYIRSSKFDVFRKKAFLNLFRRIVREDAGLDI